MRDHQTKQTGFPAPKWCFVLLGIPTFYMPLAYLAFAAWAIVGILTGGIGDRPEWMTRAAESSLYVTLAMLPIYVAWIGFSKRLARREKLGWWLIVVLLNMLGMPMFYVFILRRYLGLEGRTGKLDDAAVNRFLSRHAINRDRLSSGQLDVLRSYCRKCRMARWSLIPLSAGAALGLYIAVVSFPAAGVRIFADFAPTRVAVVDSSTAQKQQIGPDPETMKMQVQNVMMFGAMCGVFGAMSLFILVPGISQAWGSWHRKALIEFLKATEREQ